MISVYFDKFFLSPSICSFFFSFFIPIQHFFLFFVLKRSGSCLTYHIQIKALEKEIMDMKRKCPKKDKAKQEELKKEIARMESELAERQAKEIEVIYIFLSFYPFICHEYYRHHFHEHAVSWRA